MSRSSQNVSKSTRRRGRPNPYRRLLVVVAALGVVAGSLLFADSAIAAPPLPTPHLTLTKTAAPAFSSPPKAGDTIDYSFTITNDGNADLTGVIIVDNVAGVSSITYTWPGPAGVLDQGQSATGTATYPITQSDVNNGGVVNTAIANGQTAGGTNVTSNTAGAVTEIDRVSSLALVKIADATGIGTPPQPGDQIVYTLTVTNKGNITVYAVGITDPLPGLPPLTFTWPGVPRILDPNQSATATAIYPITAANITADQVINTATATGIDATEDPVTSNPASTTTTLSQAVTTPPPTTPTTPASPVVSEGTTLADTGSTIPALAPTTGALLVLSGLVITVSRRRPRHGR